MGAGYAGSAHGWRERSFVLPQIALGFGDRHPPPGRPGPVKGEGASASLLREPQSLSALRDKKGGVC